MIDHTPINFHNDRLTEIQSILNKLEPHEHADGINECAICDQGLDEAILLELRKTLVLREIRSRKPLEGETVCPPAPQEQEKWEIARKFAKRIKWEQSHSVHPGGYDVNLVANIVAAIEESWSVYNASIERLSAPPLSATTQAEGGEQ
jgi:hypothetical protein